MATENQCSWCGVVGGHDPRCYVGKTRIEKPASFDYQAAFDTATRQWAKRQLERNATMGPFELSSSAVLSEINTLRHAYGLPILKYDAMSDAFTTEA